MILQFKENVYKISFVLDIKLIVHIQFVYDSNEVCRKILFYRVSNKNRENHICART